MKNIGGLLIVIFTMFSCDVTTSVCVKNYTLTPVRALVHYNKECSLDSSYQGCLNCDSLTFVDLNNEKVYFKRKINIDLGVYFVQIPENYKVFLVPITLGNCIDKVSVISSVDTLEVIDFEKSIKEYKSKGILETKYPNRYTINISDSILVK